MSETRYLKWILPSGIAVSSLILWKDLIDAEQTIRYLYLTIFGAGIIIYLWSSCKSKFEEILPQIVNRRNLLFVCIVVWLSATIISLNVALQKSEGYVEAARVFFFLLSYLWVSLCVRIDSKNALYISIGFCFIGFWLSAVGLKDFVAALSAITPDNSYYEMGTMGNRNLLAIMISLSLPFHFMVFEHYKTPLARTCLLLNFLLGISVIALTGSRVGWLGLAVLFLIGCSFFFIAMVKGSIERRDFRKVVPAFIAAIIILVIPAYLLLLKYPVVSEVAIQRLQSLYSFNSEKNIHTESINERLHIWNNSLELIKEHPLSGVGAGNWKFHYAKKGLPERSQKGSVVFLQPHNDFLWVFSETGIFGGFAFILLFILAIISIIKSYHNGRFGAIHLTIFTGIILYAIASFFDFPKERPLILFTFACLIAFSNSIYQEKNKSPVSVKTAKAILTALLMVSFFTAWLWVSRMKGELNLKKAISARQTGNFKAVKNYLDEINPTFFESDLSGTPIDWYRSELAYYKQDRSSFKKYSENSIKLNPYQLYNLYNLGSIYYKEGDLKTAIYYWEKAVNIAPRFTDAAVNLSAAYYNQKNYAGAAELLAKPEVNYQNESYGTIVATVLGRYINMISDTIAIPVLKNELSKLSLNPDRVKKLQSMMAGKNESIRDAAISEAINRASEVEHNMGSQEAENLKSYYGLNR